MTFIKELRDLAGATADCKVARQLRAYADDLVTKITTLEANPTKDNMRDVVGLWTRAELFASKVVINGHDPSGAKMRLAA
jgi:hypothetical protein